MIARNADCPLETLSKGLPNARHITRSAAPIQTGNSVEVAGQDGSRLFRTDAERREDFIAQALRQYLSQQSWWSAPGFLEPLAPLKIGGGDDRVEIRWKRVVATDTGSRST